MVMAAQQGGPREREQLIETFMPSIAGVAATRGFIATGLNLGSSAAFSDCEEFFPNQTNSK